MQYYWLQLQCGDSIDVLCIACLACHVTALLSTVWHHVDSMEWQLYALHYEHPDLVSCTVLYSCPAQSCKPGKLHQIWWLLAVKTFPL